MTNEILKIIEKDLPAQVGKLLMERLQKADKDEQMVKDHEKQIANLLKTVSKLELTITEYSKKDSCYAELGKREKAVEASERDLKLKTLEYQLSSEKEKTLLVKEITMGLVRNTEYRRILSDYKSGPEGRDQYGQVYHATHTQNSDELKEAK